MGKKRRKKILYEWKDRFEKEECKKIHSSKKVSIKILYITYTANISIIKYVKVYKFVDGIIAYGYVLRWRSYNISPLPTYLLSLSLTPRVGHHCKIVCAINFYTHILYKKKKHIAKPEYINFFIYIYKCVLYTKMYERERERLFFFMPYSLYSFHSHPKHFDRNELIKMFKKKKKISR